MGHCHTPLSFMKSYCEEVNHFNSNLFCSTEISEDSQKNMYLFTQLEQQEITLGNIPDIKSQCMPDIPDLLPNLTNGRQRWSSLPPAPVTRQNLELFNDLPSNCDTDPASEMDLFSIGEQWDH